MRNDANDSVLASSLVNNVGGNPFEIIDYTSKTSTSFDGLSSAKAGTTRLATAVNADVWPVVYTQVTINPLVATDTNVNVADASSFVAGGTTGADLLFSPSLAGKR